MPNRKQWMTLCHSWI